MNTTSVRKFLLSFSRVFLLTILIGQFGLVENTHAEFSQFVKRIFEIEDISESQNFLGVPVLELIKKSDSNDPKATGLLALCYVNGKDCSKNRDKGFKLAEKAFELGDPYGTALVGLLYANGWGTQKDVKKALQIWKWAAARDQVDCLFELGRYYTNKSNPDYDLAAGATYFERAANYSHPASMRAYASVLEFGKGRSVNMNEAFKWYKKAADAGNSSACYSWATFMREGQGTRKDFPAAFQAYETCAKKLGNTDAMVAMAEMYAEGEGVNKDLVASLTMYKKAADAKNTEGMYGLAFAIFNGLGTQENAQKGAEIWLECARLNNVRCQREYATAAMTGQGVAKNYKDALFWFEKAAAQNDIVASFDLGILLLEMNPSPDSYNRALPLIQKAADAGIPEAKQTLEMMRLLKPR